MEGSITQLGLGNYLINKKEKVIEIFTKNYSIEAIILKFNKLINNL